RRRLGHKGLKIRKAVASSFQVPSVFHADHTLWVRRFLVNLESLPRLATQAVRAIPASRGSRPPAGWLLGFLLALCPARFRRIPASGKRLSAFLRADWGRRTRPCGEYVHSEPVRGTLRQTSGFDLWRSS